LERGSGLSMVLDDDRNRKLIDGLRAVGMYYVVLFHVLFALGRILDPAEMHAFFDRFPDLLNFAFQPFGTELIFFFSAFLLGYLMLLEHREYGTLDVGRYYRRRIVRIFPIYFLALLLYMPLAKELTLFDVAANLLFINHIVGAFPIIPAGWSLQVLVQSYLVLPWLVLGLMASGRPLLVLGVLWLVGLAARYAAMVLDPSFDPALIAGLFIGEQATPTANALYELIWFRTSPFLLGLALAFAVVRDHARLSRWLAPAQGWIPLMLVGSALVFVTTMVPIYDGRSFLYTHGSYTFWIWFQTLQNGVFGLGLLACTLALFYARSRRLDLVTAWLRLPVWKQGAQNIFPIYLFHMVFIIPAAALVFWTIKPAEVPPVHTWQILLIFVIASVLSHWVAVFLVRFYERPVQGWLGKWLLPPAGSESRPKTDT
jgi:peptidoglycan/LPS O-acetylase OafA/YrhL